VGIIRISLETDLQIRIAFVNACLERVWRWYDSLHTLTWALRCLFFGSTFGGCHLLLLWDRGQYETLQDNLLRQMQGPSRFDKPVANAD
jgi:hypothetical protein